MKVAVALVGTALWPAAVNAAFDIIQGDEPYQFSGIVKRDSNSTLCTSAACVHAASEVLYNLSPDYKTIDPCNHFDQLVCAGFNDRHELRADQGGISTATVMSDTSDMVLKHILEGSYPQNSSHSTFSPRNLARAAASADEENFNKMQTAYNTCMDMATIQSIGATPLVNILHQILELYPASASSSNSTDDKAIQAVMQYFGQMNIGAWLNIGTGADDKDPDTVVVTVGPPSRFGLSAIQYYQNDTIVNKYKAVVSQVLTALVPDLSNVTLSAVVDFEKVLANVAPTPEERRDITQTYNKLPLNSTSAMIPQYGLEAYINSLKPSNVTITDIVVAFPKYLGDLSKVVSATPSEILRAYFLWKAVQAFSSLIESDAIMPIRRFNNELAGKDPETKPERWRTCLSHIDNGLGWILSRFYIEKLFSEDAKKLGDQIVSDIKDIYIDRIQSKPWLQQDEKDTAIQKVKNIVQKIGYSVKSPNVMDAESLEQYYAGITITANSYFGNALSIRQWDNNYTWNALGKPVNKDEWGMTASTVNAYYNPSYNEIVFPAGIMQPPVFDVALPDYMSYGAFGAVAGHELSHAFDDGGRHYDEYGRYNDWWSNNTVAEFNKRAKCFIDQFSNYTVEGPDGKPLNVNGNLTQGENIADSGGIQASYAAWQKRIEAGKGSNSDLPGLDFFTHEQLFFVNYANWWCAKTRKETVINRIYTDPHSPNPVRILGTLANSRDFKTSFNCPVKDPVCEIW